MSLYKFRREFYGLLLNSMDSFRFLLVSLDFDWNSMIPIDFYGFLLISIDFLWDFNRFLLISIGS